MVREGGGFQPAGTLDVQGEPCVITFTSLNMKVLLLTRKGLPLAVVTFFRMTSRVLTYGYFSA